LCYGELLIRINLVVDWTVILNLCNGPAYKLLFNHKSVYWLGIRAVRSKPEVKEFFENEPVGKIHRMEHFPLRAKVPVKRNFLNRKNLWYGK